MPTAPPAASMKSSLNGCRHVPAVPAAGAPATGGKCPQTLLLEMCEVNPPPCHLPPAPGLPYAGTLSFDDVGLHDYNLQVVPDGKYGMNWDNWIVRNYQAIGTTTLLANPGYGWGFTGIFAVVNLNSTSATFSANNTAGYESFKLWRVRAPRGLGPADQHDRPRGRYIRPASRKDCWQDTTFAANLPHMHTHTHRHAHTHTHDRHPLLRR